MTDFINKFAQRTILAVLFVSFSANVVMAQFPVEESDSMVGSWKVTNLKDHSIQLQINSQNQFQMSVNGKASKGKIETTDNSVSLDFSDGTQQKFKKSFVNGQLIFESAKGPQRFVMVRTDVKVTPPAKTTGFPTGPATDSDSDSEEVEEDTSDASPKNQIMGKWYAKLKSDQVEVYVKSDFRSDGTYSTSILLVAGKEKETQKDKGRWTVQDGKLISVSDGETEKEIVPFKFSGKDLVVDMTNEFGTQMVMSRSPDQVKPSQFDIKKLIEYAQGQANGGR